MFRDRGFGALYCGPTSPVALSAKAQSNASQRLFLGRLPLRARRLRGKDYVEEVLPGSHGAPSSNWDFSRHGGDDRLRLRDHGNETVVGLVLLYTLENYWQTPRTENYRPAIAGMLDRILLGSELIAGATLTPGNRIMEPLSTHR